MEAAIRDAIAILRRTSRDIAVGDSVRLGAGEVENVEGQADPALNAVADTAAEQSRGRGAYRVILDEWARPELAKTHRTEPAEAFARINARRNDRGRELGH